MSNQQPIPLEVELTPEFQRIAENIIKNALQAFAFPTQMRSVKPNVIPYIVSLLHENTSVNRLNLSCQFFTSHNFRLFVGLLLNENKNILGLNLSFTVFRNTEDMKFLADILKKRHGLAVLELKNCYIDVQHLKFLANSLEENNRLRYLDLSSNPIRFKGSKWIAHILKTNHGVRVLKLGSCNLIELKKHRIKEDDERIQVKKDGIRKILEALLHNQTLKELDLNSNLLCNDLPEYVKDPEQNALVLYQGPSLEERLAAVIREHQILESLNLFNVGLSFNGGKRLSEALKGNKTLKHLEVSCNFNMGLEGARAFLEAADTNRTLLSLHLIRAGSAQTLAHLVPDVEDWEKIQNEIIHCVSRNTEEYKRKERQIISNTFDPIFQQKENPSKHFIREVFEFLGCEEEKAGKIKAEDEEIRIKGNNV